MIKFLKLSDKTKNILKAVGIDIGRVCYWILFGFTFVVGLILTIANVLIAFVPNLDVAFSAVISNVLCIMFQAYHHRQKFKDYLDDAVKRNILKEKNTKQRVDAWGRKDW